MSYFVPILLIFAFWFPFAYILNLIFYVLQIPFAAIHRYAVYAVMLFKVYLQSSYLSMLCMAAAYQYDLSVAPFAIIFLPALYFETLSYFRNNSNESSMAFGRIANWFAPLTFIITPYFIIPAIGSALVSVQQFGNTIAFFNGITLWISYIFGFICLVITFVKAVLYLHTISRAKTTSNYIS